MLNQAKYVYGIVMEAQPRVFDFRGLEGAEVYTINHRDVAAIVSNSTLAQTDPTRKNVLAHTLVQDELLKKYTVLPMGFGAISADDKISVLLEKNYEIIDAEIRRLSGKVEVELKIFWDEKAMAKQIQGDSEGMNRLKTRIGAATSTVEAQSLLIEAGRLVERVGLEWKARYTQEVMSSLKELSIDSCVNQTIGVKNIFNVSFLICKGSEAEFQRRVRDLDVRYEGKLNFKYVGPLPPYNFIGLRLEK